MYEGLITKILLASSEQAFNMPLCGGLEMAPHVNHWSALDGAHKSQVTVIITTSELS